MSGFALGFDGPDFDGPDGTICHSAECYRCSRIDYKAELDFDGIGWLCPSCDDRWDALYEQRAEALS